MADRRSSGQLLMAGGPASRQRREPSIKFLGLVTDQRSDLQELRPAIQQPPLRNDATLTLSRFETSCSVIRLTMISPLSVE